MLLLERASELLEENRLREAEFMFKQVLKQNPKNGKALFGLGRICMRLEQYDNAIYYLKRACEHLPKMLDPLYALADAFVAVGSPVDAKTVLEYTLSVARHNAQAHYHLGQFYLDYGFIDNARNVFEAGLACPHSGITVFMIHELIKLTEGDKLNEYLALLDTLDADLENPRLHIVTHYAKANAYEKLANIDAAFSHYQQANTAQHALCDFHTSAMQPFFDYLKRSFNEAYFAKPADKVKATFTPVFIVGLPRTGSTLLEQMLIQHSQVGSMGESTVISDDIVPYLSMRNEAPFPDCTKTLSTSMLDHCRNLYVDEIKRHRVAEEAVINKLPANFQNIGLIYKMFPDARFIHMTREFMPNAWSVYSNHFAEDEPYFCSLQEYQLYSDMTDDVMAHFKAMLPRNIHTMSYEKLLEEPEREIRKALNFMYQKYEPECMEFYKSHKVVSTLSKAQVRKPLNTAPLVNWKKFEAQITKELASPDSP
ncbi:tetratricopeptide repeat-containing sulfotransferase family protein [Pseudoalteromonas viridis]|uniref:Sulfotransferase n=1 Tax=Pseudoalteromonas viridis TaxID=339617 RepID=A0ABX7VHB9_9GAMM|nr:sulfotransferase [Pseudoalteromonas viridis]QTL38149.1 sulfotransferase [Pseudoalteromonas viridis]